MALSYDPTTKQWSPWDVTQEKTDYQTDFPTNLEVPDTINLWATTTTSFVPNKAGAPTVIRWIDKIAAQSTNPGQGQPDSGGWTSIGAVSRSNFTRQDLTDQVMNKGLNFPYYGNGLETLYGTASATAATYSANEQTNALNTTKNQENAALNTENTNRNTDYQTVLRVASSTEGGDYVTQRNRIRKLQGVSDAEKTKLEEYFKAFYKTEKLRPWDPSLGAKPAYGDFDPKYYKSINPAVEEKWKAAVADDDIDLTEQYSEGTYYLQHYTMQGKPAGMRGNAIEKTIAADQIMERKPTDLDIQAARNAQLGVDTETQDDRLLKIPEIKAEWEKAKAGDEYWKKLGKENSMDPNKQDEFAVLFRLSERPQDKQLAVDGITELEDVLNRTVGEKATVDAKKFSALTQNVLKDTIAEMKKAKEKEQMLDLMQGFSGFGEIMNINKELSNSILGDSGVGGILAFTSGKSSQESLEKSLQNITGVNNNVTYNWQQWFDSELKKKYDKDVELGYDTETAKETIKVEAQFARDFIDKYLIPRFNRSRSISEFTEYLDVRSKEQNPFQTQGMLNAVSQIANLRAEKFLTDAQNTEARLFDPEFYFNPTGGKNQDQAYQAQANAVGADWEIAKTKPNELIEPGNNNLGTWAQQAYRFGLDLNNKNDFARLHFQLIGSKLKDPSNIKAGTKYDGAKDILTQARIEDEIYNNILPALEAETLKQGTIFGQFITPEEFADEVLKGLDPNDKTTWQEALDTVGLKDFQGNIDEFRDLVSETLRTGSAQTIREQIKYLNEKGKKPTQKLLGVEYIERPEDYKTDSIKSETQLYKTFQQAGYKGTEDEFYKDVFPDTDRTEQQLLTKAGTGSAFEMNKLDFSDPFASLGTLQSFFGDQEDTSDEDTADKEKSIFNLGLDDEETNYKSKTGSDILGEFTSMFKGF